MIDLDMTYCSRPNRCRHRLKCIRYTTKFTDIDKVWFADFFQEYGRECHLLELQDQTTAEREV
jgi:hypothetical protein